MNLDSIVEEESKGFFDKFYDFVGGNKWARRSLYTLYGLVVFGTTDLLFNKKVFGQEKYGDLTFQQILKDDTNGVDGLNNPVSIAISPDSKNIYVASYGDNALAIFKRDLKTGNLTFQDTLKYNNNEIDFFEPQYVKISHDGKNVYVLPNWRELDIIVFKRDSISGELTVQQIIDENDIGLEDRLWWPKDLLISPNDENIYISGISFDDIIIFKRDLTTGNLTFQEKEFFVDDIIAINPDGKYFYEYDTHYDTGPGGKGLITEIDIYSIDNNGSLDFKRGFDLNRQTIKSMTISPDGKNIYLTRSTTKDGTRPGIIVLKEDPISIQQIIQDISYDPLGVEIGYVDFGTISPDNKNFYTVGYIIGETGTIIDVFERDSINGNLTLQQTLKLISDKLPDPGEIIVSPDNKNVYILNEEYGHAITVFKRNTGEPIDIIPPSISNLTPAINTTNIPLNSNIEGDIKDNESGVNWNTLEMKLNEESVNPTLSDITNGKHFFYDPDTLFSGIQYSVNLKIKDNQGNLMDTTYVFTTIQNPADLTITDLKTYTNEGDGFPTAGENSTIEFLIKNTGEEIWKEKDLIARVVVWDLYNVGIDGVQTQLKKTDRPRRPIGYYDLKNIGDITPGNSVKTKLEYIFTAPDFSERLEVKLLPSIDGQLIDGSTNLNNSQSLYDPDFKVKFNNFAYVNLLGEFVDAFSQSTIGTDITGYLKTTLDLKRKGQDLLSESIEIIEDIKNKNLEQAGEKTIDLVKGQLITVSELAGDELLGRMIPYYGTAWNETHGVGGGAALGHLSIEFWRFIDGLAKKLAENYVNMVAVKSPADLYIKDELGNTLTSVDKNGNTTGNDLNIAYLLGEVKFGIFKQESGKIYTTELKGTDTDTIGVIITQKKDTVQTITYNVPIQQNHTAKVEIGANVIDDTLRVYDENDNLKDVRTDIKEILTNTNIPKEFQLFQNYPNPWNPATHIKFQLNKYFPEVDLKVYDVKGQMIIDLVDGAYQPGTYFIEWTGKNENGLKVASGVYIYRLRAGNNIDSKKMVFFK